jgi:hypothetical protein
MRLSSRVTPLRTSTSRPIALQMGACVRHDLQRLRATYLILGRSYGKSWRVIAALCVMLNFCAPTDACAQEPIASSRPAPLEVVKRYLRAARSRDFETAYQHLSSLDRSVRDKKTYLLSQDNLTGFSLTLARRLQAATSIWMIEQKLASTKARLEVGYRALTADEISSQLHDWNQDKLNSLSLAGQIALLDSLDQLKNNRRSITIEGRDSFDLVLDKTGWKIFLDWPSQHRVLLRTLRPQPDALGVHFLRNDLLVKPEEPFQVDVKIVNRSDRELMIKLNHLFEPRKMEKNIAMIACGSLLPFGLSPRQNRDISSAYILRDALPRRAPLEIIYDFSAVADQRQLSKMASEGR